MAETQVELLPSVDQISRTLSRSEIELLLEQHHLDSFTWALACCRRNFDLAQDILQMSYVKILDGSAQFEARSSFRTWLFGVIRRTAVQTMRNLVVREKLLRTLFIRRNEPIIPEPHTSLEYSLESEKLVQALLKLSNKQCAVLQLVFYHDMTIEEAAKVMKVSLGSARTHYARGKKNLADRLKDRNNE